MTTRWEDSNKGTRNEDTGYHSISKTIIIDGQEVDLSELYARTQHFNTRGQMTTLDGIAGYLRTGTDPRLVTGTPGADYEIGVWLADNLRGALLQDNTTQAIIAVKVNQVSHGFSDLDVIGQSGGSFVKADPSSDIPAIGLALKTQDDADVWWLASSGIWQVTSHGKSVGENFVSNTTPGAMTTTRPTPGQKVQLIAFVIDADTFIINPAGPMLP